MSKYVLGLDIGIASVGWGIIDIDSSTIIDCGVRIFPEGDKSSNEDRRNARSSRRLLSRKIHRLDRIKKLLINNKIIDNNFKHLDNPYEIRKKGLKEKLTNEELATAVLHIAKRRGITGEWIIADDDKEAKENETTKKTLSHNKSLLKHKYICEIQLERLEQEKTIRGFSNIFTTDDYIKELNKIFENQSISKQIQQKIIDLIKSKREYYEGPGSFKSPTPYGRFIENENGEIVEIDLIEKMRGRCTIYPDELRAPKMSYSAELHNFLNDLNNLEVNGEKIDYNIKKEIINIISETGKFSFVSLKKMLKVNQEKISGYRMDKNDKPLLTEFKGYRKILEYVNKNELSKIIFENKYLLDQIITILTSKKGQHERANYFTKNYSNILTTKDITYLSELSGYTGYHSLSLKAINEILPDLINTSLNQMQIFSANGYFEQKEKIYKGKKEIQFNDKLILSSVARRSQRESLKIVNAARKQYGEFDSIIIEMARDSNSIEEKKRIVQSQKHGEKLKKEIDELLKGKTTKINTKLIHKVRLYLEQNGKCPYSGESIDLSRLINDPYAYEIDHIIPLSISFDDSFKNKALVVQKANQNKGQRTPYQYLKSGAVKDWDYEKFKTYILTNDNIKWQKKYKYIFEKDINSFEVKKEFINRNLVDTRYASKGVLNTLQDYFKENEINTKVHVIKGIITDIFRKKAGIIKDRNEDFRHHAVDALIVAGIKKMDYLRYLLEIPLDNNEIKTIEEEKLFIDQEFIKFIKNLKDLNTKFSHKVDKKYNRIISDSTIYGTRVIKEKEKIIAKYKDIYGKRGEDLAKSFRDGNAEKELLIALHDPKTFKKLEQIVGQYQNEANPFLKFKEEHGYITKYSPKEKGPIIKSLKYTKSSLGSHISITNNYPNTKKGNVVLLSINPYRVDFYLDTDNVYKFLKVDHYQIKYLNKKAYIDEDLYNEERKNRNISTEAKFLFSLNKGDLFFYNKENIEDNVVKYNGTNYNARKIEYKYINKNEKQNYLTIGKQIKEIYKVHTDILGNIYKEIPKESCKFIL